MSDAYLNQQPVWKVLYEAAILEFDPKLVTHRIEEAKAAILAQLRVNQQQGGSREDEHLMEALCGLNELNRVRMSNPELDAS